MWCNNCNDLVDSSLEFCNEDNTYHAYCDICRTDLTKQNEEKDQ